MTVPLYALLLGAGVGLLPVTLPLALAVDAVRRCRFATTRALAMSMVYLACEALGVLLAAGLWLWPSRSRSRYIEANYQLQSEWARTLFGALSWIYRMTLDVEGDTALAEGPIILFARHASTADTVLPLVLFGPRAIRPRYVLKRELLFDPCLDIVGNRVPNAFVRRDGGDPDAIARVTGLLNGMSERDAVVIYPEGTRFSARGRERALVKLQGSPRLVAARALRHLLPPRVGGVLGLLEKNVCAHVVFCGHVGLEGAATFADLAKGRFIGTAVSVRLWRVPFADIPPDNREAWLDEWWARIDEWIETKLASRGGHAGSSR